MYICKFASFELALHKAQVQNQFQLYLIILYI